MLSGFLKGADARMVPRMNGEVRLLGGAQEEDKGGNWAT